MKKDKKTAVIYARYSSERQTEQSIEGQIHVCNDFAARNDIVIVDTYIDRAMTGTNDNRKDFQRMLKDCSKQAWDYVLVYKLDRFSRNKYEMAIHKKTLRDNGVKLLLTNQKADIEKSINNLILAMERGIFSDMTKSRLDELEGQLSLIKEQILHEEAQTKVSLSKEDIIAYIKSALKKEAKRLINLLVEKIILYENKIEIFYKYQKTKSPDETSQGFLFYQNTIFYNKTRVVKNVYIKKTNFTEEKFDVFHHF